MSRCYSLYFVYKKKNHVTMMSSVKQPCDFIMDLQKYCLYFMNYRSNIVTSCN